MIKTKGNKKYFIYDKKTMETFVYDSKTDKIRKCVASGVTDREIEMLDEVI